MKKIYSFLISSLIFISCANDDNDTSFDIDGQFILENSTECSSLEGASGCVTSILFIDDSNINIVYEGDMFSKKYDIENNKITIYNNFENSLYLDISLEIINKKTLKRIQNGAFYLKEDN